MLALHLALDAVEGPVEATVWDDKVKAFDMGEVAAQWFSDFLNTDADGKRIAAPHKLRLLRFNPEHQRLSSLKWTGGIEAPNQFSDGFPVLVTSEASLDGLNERLTAAGHGAVGIERFRPNIVLSGVEAHDEDRIDELLIATDEGIAKLKMVKPCPRCPIPNIDPATAVSSPEVGDTLQGYRQLAVVGGAIAFGMNAIVIDGVDFALRTGQDAAGDYRFDGPSTTRPGRDQHLNPSPGRIDGPSPGTPRNRLCRASGVAPCKGGERHKVRDLGVCNIHHEFEVRHRGLAQRG